MVHRLKLKNVFLVKVTKGYVIVIMSRDYNITETFIFSIATKNQQLSFANITHRSFPHCNFRAIFKLKLPDDQYSGEKLKKAISPMYRP